MSVQAVNARSKGLVIIPAPVFFVNSHSKLPGTFQAMGPSGVSRLGLRTLDFGLASACNCFILGLEPSPLLDEDKGSTRFCSDLLLYSRHFDARLSLAALDHGANH